MRDGIICATVLAVACVTMILGCSGGVNLNLGGDPQPFNASDFEGTWTGQWQQPSRGVEGPATMTIAVDENAKTFDLNIDLDGLLMPGVDPLPVIGTGDWDDDGATLDAAGTTLGNLTLTVNEAGAFTGSFGAVPHADVTRIDFNGTAGKKQIAVSFRVQLATGGIVAGTLLLIKQ